MPPHSTLLLWSSNNNGSRRTSGGSLAIVGVLLYTLVFSPDGVSTAELLAELALELKELGHESRVLTTTPHYSVDLDARARQPLRREYLRLVQESDRDGVRVLHVRMRQKGLRVWSQIADYARFHLVSIMADAALRGPFDVVLVTSPRLTMGLAARCGIRERGRAGVAHAVQVASWSSVRRWRLDVVVGITRHVGG